VHTLHASELPFRGEDYRSRISEYTKRLEEALCNDQGAHIAPVAADADPPTLEDRLWDASCSFVLAACARCAAQHELAIAEAVEREQAAVAAMAADAAARAMTKTAHRWIIYLWHCYKCINPVCSLREQCGVGKRLLEHVTKCRVGPTCAYPNCATCKPLMDHCLQCHDGACATCAPVRKFTAGGGRGGRAARATPSAEHTGLKGRMDDTADAKTAAMGWSSSVCTS
jgi:hypothetical protein